MLIAIQSCVADHDGGLSDEIACTLEAQVSSQVLPWPENRSISPAQAVTNEPVAAAGATGDLPYTQAALTSVFTLTGKLRDVSLF